MQEGLLVPVHPKGAHTSAVYRFMALARCANAQITTPVKEVATKAPNMAAPTHGRERGQTHCSLADDIPPHRGVR
jgi:hypothetical protein